MCEENKILLLGTQFVDVMGLSKIMFAACYYLH